MKLGYLYSRYPVISQTFCDAEMLALERRGLELTIGSVYPPLTSLRHEHISELRAPIHYAPPQEILKISEKQAKIAGKWPRDLVEQHERNTDRMARQSSEHAMASISRIFSRVTKSTTCTFISPIERHTQR